MDNNRNIYKTSETREIRLMDLFWNIAYNWRFLLGCAVIIAVLMGGVCYSNNLRSIRNIKTVQNDTQQQEMSIEELKEGLTEAEQRAVSDAEFVYTKMKKKQSYRDSSVRMNLDPYAKDVVTLQYYVDTDYVVNYTEDIRPDYSNELIEGYVSYIENQGIQRELTDYLDWDVDMEYIGELFSVGGRLASDGTATGTVNAAGNTFVIFVSGESRERAEELAECIEKLLDEYREILTEKIGSHRLILIDKYGSVVTDAGLAQEQEVLDNSIAAYQTKLDTLTAAFSDTQLLIYEGEIEGEVKQSPEDGEEATTENSVSVPEKPTSNVVKYIVLGAICGIFLACICITLVYILNNKIKSSEELAELYGLRVFGKITVPDGKRRIFAGVDRWIDQLRYKEKWTLEEQLDLVLTNLKVTCRKENIEKLFFTSAIHLTAEEKTRIEEVMANLKENGVEVLFGENIIRNAKSFEQMAEIGQVVLIERERASEYSAIEKEIVLCMEQKASLIGVIGMCSGAVRG